MELNGGTLLSSGLSPPLAFPIYCNISELSISLERSAALDNNSKGLLRYMDKLRLCSDLGLLDPFDESEFNVLKKPNFAAFVVAIYVIVISIGALGNLLVVLTISTTKRMQTATNIFIANLAIADIFVCVFDLPLNLYYQLGDDWVHGKALCHVFLATFGVIVYVSILSMTMIAVDRFFLIVTPDRRRMTVRIALIVVGFIAMVSIVLSLPLSFFADYMDINHPVSGRRMRYCREMWPTDQLRKIYTVVTLTMQFFIPLTVIAALYIMIFWKVRSTRRSIKSASKNRKKSKTNMMLVAVVLFFAICWIPYQIFSVILEFKSKLVPGSYLRFIDLMLRLVAMSSSCVNPILYGWLNDNFRDAFLVVVRLKKSSSPLTAHTSRTVTTQGYNMQRDGGPSEVMLQLVDSESLSRARHDV